MKKAQFFSRLSLVLALLFCFTGFTAGQVAFASKALPPQVKILLGFKERYGPDNKLHYGIDVCAEKGTELYAPAEGTISFVGRVPGSAGLNVTALTITTEAGHQISINPFATTTVKKGDVVEKGQVLGTVSDVGDPSSAESHFHLSLREKGVYKDPTHLLMETISTVGENGGAVDNAVAATTPPVSKSPANSSTASAQDPATQAQKQPQTQAQSQPQAQSQTQVQKTETKPAELKGAQTVAKPAIDAGTNVAVREEKSSTAAPATIAQSDLVDEQEQGKSVIAEPKKEAAALSASNPDTVLQFGQMSASSLRAELIAYFSEMSQAQLTAALFAVGALLSCAGVGAWKVVQLLGFDSALLNFRKNLSVAAKAESSEGGES